MGPGARTAAWHESAERSPTHPFWLVLGVGAALLAAEVVALGSGVLQVGDLMTSASARWVRSW